MLQVEDSRTLDMLKQRIRKITPIKRMIAFGSRARGSATRESDLDVFIEVPDLTSQIRLRIFDVAWEIGLDREVVISLFLASTGMLEDSPLTANPILHPIFQEGVVI